MKSVALVTCPEYPTLHPEDTLLIRALKELGMEAQAWDWHRGTPTWNPAGYMLRTCWDYHQHPVEFLQWLQSLRPVPLWNPYELVHWNSHKSYLLELAGRGVPIIPTRLLVQGTAWSEALEEELRELWGEETEWLFKPAIGAGARHTRRFTQQAVDRNWLHHQLLQKDMLAQPYDRSIEGYGERSLIYVDGQYSHAVQRPETLREGQGEDRIMQRVQPTVEELAVSQQALDCLPHPEQGWLYARVDLVDGPRLMELEVIEPRLFLLEHPPAAEALAQALARRL